MKTKEEQKAYYRALLKERYTRMALSFENDSDADIIKHLDEVRQNEKVTNYIRRLIRSDIAKNGK